jgi:RNA polymerase sigma factor (sigma-70 family)
MDVQPTAPRTTREVAEVVLVNQRERAKLFAYANSRFGICANDAEDLLQETALELLRQRSYVRSPEAFVFTVFRARCARFIGSLRAKRDVFASSATHVDNVAAPMGAEQFDRQLALRQALGLISSPCRRLLSAYYVEGVDLKEAGRRLSLAYASVSTTLSRCLRKLRECLA